MTNLVRYIDLGVIAAIFFLLVFHWRDFYKHSKMARTGFQLSALMFLCLFVSVTNRILTDADDTLRYGYGFAVLGRVGVFLMVSALLTDDSHNCRGNEETDTEEHGVHDTPPEGIKIPMQASHVPQEFHA